MRLPDEASARDSLEVARERLGQDLGNADDWRTLEFVATYHPVLAGEARALLVAIGDACPWLLDVPMLLARRPAPSLDGVTVQELAALGIAYQGSYRAWEGMASFAKGQAVHVLTSRWSPAGPAADRRDMTDQGIACLLAEDRAFFVAGWRVWRDPRPYNPSLGYRDGWVAVRGDKRRGAATPAQLRRLCEDMDAAETSQGEARRAA